MQALFKMIKHKVPVATIFNVQSNNPYKYYGHEVPYDHVLMDKTSDMSADPIQRMDTLKYT